MFFLDIITRIGISARRCFVFIVSIPVATFAFIASLFFGNPQLQYQNSIKGLLRFVLSRFQTNINNYDVLLDTRPPYILAANHANYFDWMILYSRIKMNMSVVTDSFFTRFPFSAVTKNAGFLTIKQRCSFIQSKDILNILEAIHRKESVLIFVNSRTDPSRFFDSIKPGAAYLSIKTQVPVIPVHIKESEGKKGFDITFGYPIYPETEDISKAGEFMQKIGRSIQSLG